ncbi:hypothetical protein Tco_1235139 [Tanacetum coccineum]
MIQGFGVESSSSMESDNSSGNTNSTESLYPNFQKAKGFHSVPPPTGTIIPPRANVSFTGIDELAIRNKVLNQENTKSCQPEIDRNKVIIEDWVDSDDEETVLNSSEIQKKTVLNSENSETSFENKSPSSQNSVDQGSRKKGFGHKGGKTCFGNPEKIQRLCYMTVDCSVQYDRRTKDNCLTLKNSKVVMWLLEMILKEEESQEKEPSRHPILLRLAKLAIGGLSSISYLFSQICDKNIISPNISFMRPFGCPLTILNTLDQLGKFDGKSEEGYLLGYSTSSKGFRVYNRVTRKVQDCLHVDFLENQKMKLKRLKAYYTKVYRSYKGYVDSGCSRHMTGNMSYLSDFKEFDGGYVTFGGGAKGGKITGKGTLKTGKLDFKDVYFVKE